MLVPPKQRIPITPFDIKTQRDAFTVSLEGLKGVRPLCSVLPLLLCCASWPCRALKLITQLTLSTVESQCPRTGVCPSQRGPQKTGWFCVPDFSCSDIHYRPPANRRSSNVSPNSNRPNRQIPSYIHSLFRRRFRPLQAPPPLSIDLHQRLLQHRMVHQDQDQLLQGWQGQRFKDRDLLFPGQDQLDRGQRFPDPALQFRGQDPLNPPLPLCKYRLGEWVLPFGQALVHWCEARGRQRRRVQRRTRLHTPWIRIRGGKNGTGMVPLGFP